MSMNRINQRGLTLVELMVALAIGSFLIIGAVQIYNQSRQAFVVNESIARVQETAQFAMDTIESDLRMASNWGRNSRAVAVEGASRDGDPNPLGLTEPENDGSSCGEDWAYNLLLTVDGVDDDFTLPCAAVGGEQEDSDSVTIRRASVDPVAPVAGRLQIQTTRIAGQIFESDTIPGAFSPADSTTHNLLVNTYYVAADSDLIPGVPTLRRKSLGPGPAITDQEVAPGVESLQIQLGVDVDEDNTVDRYVNPGDAIYRPGAVGYVPGARVITARVWLVVRGITPEIGLIDDVNYAPANADLGNPDDEFRRMMVSKTILLRNART